MDDSPHQSPSSAETTDLERRQFLRKAAVAGAVWAVPTVIAIKPAAAKGLHSSPPEKPRVDPIPKGLEPVAKPPPQPAQVSPTELAFTGADVEKLTIAGVAATVAGAAMLILSGEVDADEATNPRAVED